MSLPEVIHRVQETSRHAADRRLDGGWDMFPALGSEAPQIPGLAERLRTGSTEGLRSAIAVTTQGVLSGRCEMLGVEWPRRDADDLYPLDLWRTDPVSGALWPGAETASADIGYRRQTSLGSVKYVWEISGCSSCSR
jgi:hypothetical protein